MEGCDYIFYCVVVVFFDLVDVWYLCIVNIIGMANVVNIVFKLRIRKLLYVSLIVALGWIKQGIIIIEIVKWECSFFNIWYVVSKYQGEMEVWCGYVEGLDVVVVNFFIVFGSGFWESGLVYFFFMVDEGFFFYFVGMIGLVDVWDVVWYMVWLMESNIRNECFIFNVEYYFYKQLLMEVVEVLGVKLFKYKVGKILCGLFWCLVWL